MCFMYFLDQFIQKGILKMAYLNENEWILLNEITYNIHFVYTIEDLQEKIIRRWLPFLIPYDAGVFAQLHPSGREDGQYELINPVGYQLSQPMVALWKEQTQKHDRLRWVLYGSQSIIFRESALDPEDRLLTSEIYRTFYQPNRLCYSIGTCDYFREEPVGLLRLYRREENGPFRDRDQFVLAQLNKHLSYRLAYEAKKGDSHFFYAKGYHDKLCQQYGLTTREGEMLDLAVRGFSNEEIAQQLSISIHTVKKHFNSIYSKMGVHNRVQMMQCFPVSTSKIDFDSL